MIVIVIRRIIKMSLGNRVRLAITIPYDVIQHLRTYVLYKLYMYVYTGVLYGNVYQYISSVDAGSI